MGEEDDDMVLKDTEIAIPYKKNTTIGKTNFKDNFVQGVSKYFNIPAEDISVFYTRDGNSTPHFIDYLAGNKFTLPFIQEINKMSKIRWFFLNCTASNAEESSADDEN